jgi:signal transduction histidine kinase
MLRMAKKNEDPIEEVRALLIRALGDGEGASPALRGNLLEALRKLDEVEHIPPSAASAAKADENHEPGSDPRQVDAQWEVQHRLMNLRERERMAIARDLHDGPVQDLIAISFGLLGAEQLSGESAVVDALQEMRKALHEQITALRNYAGELRPPALGKFGLEKAIRAHAEQFREKHPEISLTLHMHQVGPLTSEPVRLALYRIYQEAMKNVVRHSEATEVHVSFEKDEHQAEFEVRDNGKGFVLPEDWLDLAREGHLGLVGIQERAEAIGGVAIFTSFPGRGTAVLIRINKLEFESPTGPRWW